MHFISWARCLELTGLKVQACGSYSTRGEYFLVPSSFSLANSQCNSDHKKLTQNRRRARIEGCSPTLAHPSKEGTHSPHRHPLRRKSRRLACSSHGANLPASPFQPRSVGEALAREGLHYPRHARRNGGGGSQCFLDGGQRGPRLR